MRLAVPLEPRQSAPHGAADVEAATGGGHVALAPPPDVALHLVTGVETLALDQARREAERHGGVVGPLAGLQVERTAADHVVDRLEGAGRLELESGAERVTGRQAEQAATEAVLRADLIQRALLPRGLCPLTDVRVLLGRFRGARLAVRLLHALPPLRDPAQGFISRRPVPHEPATDDGAGSPDPAPAVEVDGPRVVERAVDGVEDVGHLPGAAGHAQVDDWVPLMLHVSGETASLVGRDRGIRLQPVGGPGQVDEVVDACEEQGAQPGRSLVRILRARVLTGRDAARDHPVGVEEWAIRVVCLVQCWRPPVGFNVGLDAEVVLIARSRPR